MVGRIKSSLTTRTPPLIGQILQHILLQTGDVLDRVTSRGMSLFLACWPGFSAFGVLPLYASFEGSLDLEDKHRVI